MAKINTPMLLSALLFLCCSCKKQDSFLLDKLSVTPLVKGITETVSTIVPPLDVAPADTLVPANAISVKKYGAKGDGISDDTKAIQNAINAEGIITLPKGTYIINATINMRSGVKVYGATGAIVKAGNSMGGTLSTNGRYLNIESDNNCLINNIIFAQSARSYRLNDWSNACIYIYNSQGSVISNNTFNFTLPYSVTGLQAVWVSGSQSSNTLIKGNSLTNVGIEYAESGASGTIVNGNTIKHAPSDALMAHGNTDDYCTGNVIVNNVIENAGFMGIEDWGKVDGTIIRNNTITGTGKDPAQKAEGMGISAVGVNTRVVGNRITDAQLYYIEVAGNRNHIIDSNIVNDNEGKAVGIMVNFRDEISTRAFVNGATITNNSITGTHTALMAFGDNTHNSVFKNNTIRNPRYIGIHVDGASPTYVLEVVNNKISFDVPNKQLRKAFESYTNLPHGTGNQNLQIRGNEVTYATTAAGGPGLEYGFQIGTDYTTLDGNKLNGNNIKAGGSMVWGITGNTDPALNITLTNNIILGAVNSFTDFTIKAQSGNNF